MSFGAPNAPYGQQPGQPGNGQPPGWGQQPPPPGHHAHPSAAQAAPPGYGQPVPGQHGYGPPGYGYPQAPPLYPHGAAPMSMPGLIMTGRVFLFVLSAFFILGGLLFGLMVGALQDVSNGTGSGEETDWFAGLGFLVAAVSLGLGALSIFLGVKIGSGGTGIRVTTIVHACLLVLLGVGNIVGGEGGTATFAGVLWVVMSGTVLVSMVTPQASAWFDRPRH
ncbi:hypothetical protein [Streptomyces sp. NPDC049906]|uniref:hypothetical protein n=1 Tax=Streptomyces sp. NPDC049906 TaxID=3155656 RepID=UPI00341629A3